MKRDVTYARIGSCLVVFLTVALPIKQGAMVSVQEKNEMLLEPKAEVSGVSVIDDALRRPMG